MTKIRVDFFVWETISPLKAVGRYFELIRSQIEKVKAEEKERLGNLTPPSDEEEYQTEYQPQIQAHYHEFEEVLPRLVGYSFVMMLFSQIEFGINSICREIKKRDDLPVKINDFRGDLIERFTKFLRLAKKTEARKKRQSTPKRLHIDTELHRPQQRILVELCRSKKN